ncbi:MAG TPA: plastocyanin/azurin family copper-binding protein [Chloroflexota bacterium]|nr:plastocyanin/azurin family copper-binding protein [Chloroflexota bacterium]
MKLHLSAVFSLAAAAVMATLVGCFSERQEGATEPTTGECRVALTAPIFGSTQALVAIRDFKFVQSEIRVRRGTTVTWVNCEPPIIDPHTSTSDARLWDSNLLASGSTYSRTFDEVGRFPYHCAPHPFMQAVVIVE